MDTSLLQYWRRNFVGAIATASVLLAANSSSALQATLDVELDTGLTGAFATVDITENTGQLDFSITLDASLGAQRDLQSFYFNVIGTSFTGLGIATTDAPQTPYTLSENPAVQGGAGSAFDYGVGFGNGGGPPGNGRLVTASFTLSADQPLSISDLLESSSTSGGTIDIQLLLHAQGTNLIHGFTSEAVGGNIVPEPSTALLASVGLLGLALRGRVSLPRAHP